MHPSYSTHGKRQVLQNTAEKFIEAAFRALEEDHMLPTPKEHPYLQIGRDYFGDQLHGLPEFTALEEVLRNQYPERFDAPQKSDSPEFPNTYIFSLLEAAIARSTLREDPFGMPSAATDSTVQELIEVLDAPNYELACCREVTHLTTSDRLALQLGDILIVPQEAAADSLSHAAERIIPGTFGAFNREDPRFYDPPQTLLVARADTTESNPYSMAGALSASIDRFLLLTRLLQASTVDSLWQVWGPTKLIGRSNPQYRRFREGAFLLALVRRTAVLSSSDAKPIQLLGEMLEAADVRREGMATTSFDLALSRFSRSYRLSDSWDSIIDLATALEGTLTGNEDNSDSVVLRLRSRAAALLSTENDTAQSIFSDIGLMYGLRSRLVHGGTIKESKLRGDISKISTVADAPFGVAVALAVDRFRDLVRRAFLARLCLGTGSTKLWPFNGNVAVDSELSDIDTRIAWRKAWRDQLDAIGCLNAADRARAAADFLSPHES